MNLVRRPNFAAVTVLLVAMTVACSRDSSTGATSSEAASTAAIQNPYLFEVRKGDRVSWLFGTHHFGIAYSEVAGSLEPRLKAARATYFEIGDIEYIRKSKLNRVDSLLESDLEFDLGDELGPSLQRRLVTEYGIPERIAKAMHRGSCRAFDFAFNIDQPDLDADILLRAAELRKPIFGLDDENLRLDADAAKAKSATTGAPISAAVGAPAAAALAPSCDVVELYMSDSRSAIAADYQAMFDRYRTGADRTRGEDESVNYRNRAWMKRLAPEFSTGGIFVAVGLGHLYGRESLIDLLRKEGYTVTRTR